MMNPKAKELYDAEMKRTEIKGKLRLYEDQRAEINQNLGLVNRKLKEKLDYKKFESLKRRRDRLKADLQMVISSVSPIRGEMDKINALINGIRADISMQAGNLSLIDQPKDVAATTESPNIVDEVVLLRQKYLDFAEDSTRINSMRVMASQIANELTGLLKRGNV